MNVDIGTVAAQFLFWEWMVIFGIVSLQCTICHLRNSTYESFSNLVYYAQRHTYLKSLKIDHCSSKQWLRAVNQRGVIRQWFTANAQKPLT